MLTWRVHRSPSLLSANIADVSARGRLLATVRLRSCLPHPRDVKLMLSFSAPVSI